MNKQRTRQISMWLIAVLFLLACVSPFYTAPEPAVPQPTQAPQQLGTVIAQTAAAAQTQTALLAPSPTNTSTPTRLPTSTSILPTATPTILFIFPTWTPQTPTAIFTLFPTDSGGGGAKTKAPAPTHDPNEWKCGLLGKNPTDGTRINRGANFFGLWTIKNTGIKTWDNNGVDFIYKSGFHGGSLGQDLSRAVVPGESITLRVGLTAPGKAGSYKTLWTLKVGNTEFCAMSISIRVK